MAVEMIPKKQWLIDGTEVPRDIRDLMVLVANRQIDTDKNVGALLAEVSRLTRRLNEQAGAVRAIEDSRPDLSEVAKTAEAIVQEREEARELEHWRGRAKFWRTIAGAVAATVIAAGTCGILGRLFWLAVSH